MLLPILMGFKCFTGELQILFEECNIFLLDLQSQCLLTVVFFFKLTSFIVIPKYCKINNGDCEQFCSIKKSVQKDVMCSCAKGYVLAEDGKHCVSSGTKSHDKLIAILVRLVLVKECVLNHQCCTWHRFKTEAYQLVCIFEVFHV